MSTHSSNFKKVKVEVASAAKQSEERSNQIKGGIYYS